MPYALNILTIGKLKDPAIEKIEQEYLKRLKLFKINFIELKQLSGDVVKEGEMILKKVEENPLAKFILLCEDGEEFDSQTFSKKFVSFYEEEHFKEVFLIIGGALGHSEDLRRKIKTHISLSKLTFPHRLVRPILVEQIYRAETIKSGHPYHH